MRRDFESDTESILHHNLMKIRFRYNSHIKNTHNSVNAIAYASEAFIGSAQGRKILLNIQPCRETGFSLSPPTMIAPRIASVKLAPIYRAIALTPNMKKGFAH